MKPFHFFKGALLAAALALPVFTNGCSAVQQAQSAVCCPEYAKGNLNAVAAKFDATTQGDAYSLASAASSLAAVSRGAVADVANACRNIATDLGEDPLGFSPDTTAGAPSEDAQAANYWCPKAVAKIQAANVTLQTVFDPPACEASVQAQADCQARCEASGKCDVQANPPTCKGGTLEVSCKGDCDVTAQQPTIDCEGQCTGQCTGTCEASGSVAVDCDGDCEGTCAAGTLGSGVQADGSCKGTCSGKCTLRANAKVSCSGSCSGTCDATCKATPGQVAVKCSGQCSVQATPIACKGGTLEGGCTADASCQANCNASVQARAECTPPVVSVTVTSTGDTSALVRTLEDNLPALVVVLKARGADLAAQIGAIINAGVNVSGSVTAEGAACLAAMSGDLDSAQVDFTAALGGSTSVLTAVGVP